MSTSFSPRSGVVALVAAGAFILTGCGPAIEKDATYESATALREAVLKADLPCPGEKVIDVEDSNSEEIACTSDIQIAVHPDPDDVATVAFGMQLFTDKHVLKGPNWTITGPDEVELGKVRDKLGGELLINSNG